MKSLRALALGAALGGCLARPIVAQELGRRIVESDGDVSFRFATKPGVEVCDGGDVRMDGGETSIGRWRGGREGGCVEGGAEVLVSVREGRVRAIEVGPPGASRPDRDLGEVAAAAAADWLLELASRADERAARDALLPAAIADGVEAWPRLLAIGRDRALDRPVRESALFWVSRAAADVVTEGLAELAADQSDDEDVRRAAVFALSRRPEPESVPALMDIARNGPGRGVREAALFWLAKAEDPRALQFFEEILNGDRARR